MIVLALLPVVSEPVHESLSGASTSVSGLVGWGADDSYIGRNASHGALSHHGRKDNFRENLKPDVKYIMSGFHSGWSASPGSWPRLRTPPRPPVPLTIRRL